MKRILFLSSLLLTFYICAQSINHSGITWYSQYISGVYSEDLEQPLLVSYTVLCTEGNASRDGMQFYTDKKIHTSNDKDYVNNIWDKGHLAPAADFKCDRNAMYKTFTYLNCALQHENLNRGVWKHLEAYERELSMIGDVSIFVEVYFDDKPKRVSGGAAIPIGFYKQITLGKLNRCYWFANKLPISKDFRDYECPCRN